MALNDALYSEGYLGDPELYALPQDDVKAGAIALIVEVTRKKAAAEAPLLAELSAMKVRALKERASRSML